MVHCPLCHIHLVPRVNPNSVQGGTTPQNSQCHQGAYPPWPHRRFVGAADPASGDAVCRGVRNTVSLSEPIPTAIKDGDTCARNMGSLVEDVIYLLFGDRVSCRLGWPGAHFVSRDDPGPSSHW